MPGPLSGIRVLDVGILVQGPQAGALLSDMGADVVKVELPRFGDGGPCDGATELFELVALGGFTDGGGVERKAR